SSAFDPTGCFVAEDKGSIVGCVAVTSSPEELAGHKIPRSQARPVPGLCCGETAQQSPTVCRDKEARIPQSHNTLDAAVGRCLQELRVQTHSKRFQDNVGPNKDP